MLRRGWTALQRVREADAGASAGHDAASGRSEHGACLLGSLLLFSLVVAALYARRRQPLLLHLIFTLHWAGFFLLLMSLDGFLSGKARRGSLAIGGVELWYLGVALHRTYGGRWWGTVWRTPVLGLLFQATQLAFLASAIQVALALL